MTSHPDQLQLGPEDAKDRLVLLHGWGADADDLLDLGALLVSPQTSVVALRAPEPHPYGTGRQWYDLQPIDWEALPAARSNLQPTRRADAERLNIHSLTRRPRPPESLRGQWRVVRSGEKL